MVTFPNVLLVYCTKVTYFEENKSQTYQMGLKWSKQTNNMLLEKPLLMLTPISIKPMEHMEFSFTFNAIKLDTIVIFFTIIVCPYCKR